MSFHILKILTFILLFFITTVDGQEIWSEHFSVPEKGIWGDENGELVSDFSGIESWSIENIDVELANTNDYAKTVTTSGGRFEVRDINGSVTWKTELIDISTFEKVNITLKAAETGSGKNENTKYLKAYYIIDNGEKTLLETNGENAGNWGSAIAGQKSLAGHLLQIVVEIANHYASDKVILDEVVVYAEEKEYPPAQPGDIVINELLFNPFPDGADFVEIYNNSDKEFPLKDLFLASRDKNGEITQVYSLAGSIYLIQPQSFIALTADTGGIFPFYKVQCRKCFQQVAKMPSYNNDFDFVVLLNKNNEIIDELDYDENMHHPLLADVEGVSLERINVEGLTNDPENWHSASSEAGYATPGYVNSQLLQNDVGQPVVTFNVESFSPNADGYNDDYRIKYQVEKPGYVGNVRIFDASGSMVVQLAQNEILGTSGEIIWNGTDETGQRQHLGVYIALVEIFDNNGNIYRFKDGVVLTDQLE